MLTMRGAVLPDSLVTSLEGRFDQQAQDPSSPTIVRDFAEDIEGQTPSVTEEDNNGSSGAGVASFSQNTQMNQVHPAPSIVAVTAMPMQDMGHLEGLESTPYKLWRSPIYCFLLQLYPTCLCSFFMPCVAVAQLNHKLRQKAFHSTLLVFFFFIVLVVIGIVLLRIHYLMALGFLPVIYYAFLLRQFLRKQFRLPGSDLSDCLLSFFFPFCVIAQISRHLYDFKNPCDTLPFTVDGSKEGPSPDIVSGRRILRGTVPPQSIPTVAAAPRPTVVEPVLHTPPRHSQRSCQGTSTPPVFVNISYNAHLTPSMSRFNEEANNQQHSSIPVGQTPCAVLAGTNE